MARTSTKTLSLGKVGRRFLAAFLIVALIPLFLTAAGSYWRSRTVVERILEENVGKTAGAYASDLDSFLARHRTMLQAIDNVESSALSTLEKSHPEIEGLFLLDSTGAWTAGSGPVDKLDPWALQACAVVGTSVMTHAGEGHAHEVVVGVPKGDGVLCGVVTFTLHQDMLTERAQSVAGGVAYIVDRDGRVVCHAFEEHEPHVDRGDVLPDAAREVAEAGKDWIGTTMGEQGRSFAAFATAGSLPWGVWVEVPVATAAPMRPYLLEAIVLAGIVTAITCLVGVVLVRRLTSPIEELAHAVRTVGEGNLGDEVPVVGDDEIAVLATEFNQMSASLQQSYAQLDDRVAQRTEELSYRTEELSHRTQELQAAQDFSELLLNTMQERIVVFDRDLEVVRANEAATSAYGELVGCGCEAIHRHGEDTREVCPARQVLATGKHRTEERAFGDGADSQILSVDSYPMLGSDGQPTAVVEISRDISALKRMHAQLVHQEKMASLGTLAAGLAHEIGNPLASMSSELEMLEQRWNPEEAQESLPVLRDQIRRISGLLRELVEFGRKPSNESGMTEPGAILEDVLRLLRHDPRSRGVQINSELDPAANEVCTNRDRVVQILLNLGLNALDAVEGRGDVTFCVGREHTGEIRFSVRDSGDGLSAEVKKQLFEPFFTTKPVGQGTGLGLFVSERMVSQLGGHITVDSEPGTGAEFVIVLPACACDSMSEGVPDA